MMLYHSCHGRVRSILALVGALLVFGLIKVDAQSPKAGVGSTYENCAGLRAVGTGWTYNWTKMPYVCDGIESVPMVWCDDVGGALGGDSEWLLGPNEPDVYDQCNKTTLEMVPIWREIEEAYADKLLVSPAVMWTLWLRGWRDAYVAEYGRLPRVDAVAVHCYTWTDNVAVAVDYCKQQVAGAYALGLGNVWITEWAWLGSDQGMGLHTCCACGPGWTKTHGWNAMRGSS